MSRNNFTSSHINPYSKFRYLKTHARAGAMYLLLKIKLDLVAQFIIRSWGRKGV